MTRIVDEVQEVLGCAECLFPADQVEAALDRMASEITRHLGERAPVILCVMTGGMVPTSKLLSRLDFPLQLDYVHVSRYRDRTEGGELRWIHRGTVPLDGRVVLVVDDILDEGLTLASILRHCQEAGASDVLSAVLVDKLRPRAAPVRPEFSGLCVPNRYVFGYGMDYKGYLRNARGIFALPEGLG